LKNGLSQLPQFRLTTIDVPAMRLALAILVIASQPCARNTLVAQSSTPQTAPAHLPDAPSPQKPSHAPLPQAQPCQVKNTGATMAATGAMRALAVSGLGAVPLDAGSSPVEMKVCVPHLPIVNWYARFVTGPEVKPLSVGEKGRLAVQNLVDPFNLLTITGEAGISVAADSHSPYGPGMKGYGRYVGVSFTQDMTGEFFGTFLIPSFTRQDPHYHRMPGASIPRRALHCITQIAWTRGDNGRQMINYADLAGFAFDEEFNDLYVPGIQTDVPATASRYAIDIATAPIDNFITEFLPDVARRIHVRVVLVQRIINQVATTNNSSP
jgi:hypothetical protein